MVLLHGRGGIIEHKATCTQYFTMTEHFDFLTDAYRCFLTGSCPSRSSADVAGVIFFGVCGLVPGETAECAPSECCKVNSLELTCISLTLVEKMSCLVSQSQPPEVTAFCGEILSVLFQDMDLMSKLVSPTLSPG